jgi:hypothetical protein
LVLTASFGKRYERIASDAKVLSKDLGTRSYTPRIKLAPKYDAAGPKTAPFSASTPSPSPPTWMTLDDNLLLANEPLLKPMSAEQMFVNALKRKPSS